VTRNPAIRDLVSYQLAKTAGLMSKGAALRYRREFDVSLGEWRALALLGGGSPQSLLELARAAGLDKAQMSRVVASLVRRGLMRHADTPQRGRSVGLVLTPRGQVTYQGLITAAAERDRAFRAALTPAEAKALTSILEKFARQARVFIAAETAVSQTPAADGASTPRSRRPPRPVAPA
jgi:DNA-binding MarR family transcriptional regulator